MALFGATKQDVETIVSKWARIVMGRQRLSEVMIMSTIDDVKTVVEKYIADVQNAVAAFQTGVQTKVDEAIAAYKAGEAPNFDAIIAEVNDADGKLNVPAPVVVPVADPVVA